MSLALIVYLVFTALPAITTLTMVAFSCWAVMAFTGLMFGYLMKDGYPSEPAFWDFTMKTTIGKYMKWAILCLLVSVLIPSKEVTAYMLGAYGVQTIAENEKVQELGAEGLDVLQSLMKKAKAEIEGETLKEEN